MTAQLENQCPWPESAWSMTETQYAEAITDHKLRTAISGFLMRRGWQIATRDNQEQIAELQARLKESEANTSHALKSRVEFLLAKLKESEASAAALRKVIEDIYGEEGPLPKLDRKHFEAMDKALSTSAGKEMLARLERYQLGLELAKKVIKQRIAGPDVTVIEAQNAYEFIRSILATEDGGTVRSAANHSSFPIPRRNE